MKYDKLHNTIHSWPDHYVLNILERFITLLLVVMHAMTYIAIGKTAIYIYILDEAYVKYGYTLKEISDFLGIHYTTVSRVARKVE